MHKSSPGVLESLENAVEAYEAGAPANIEVTARAVEDGTSVALSFRDEGCGILPAHLPHVFAPFGSSKPGVRGLGLLNVRKMIAAAHGGEVRIESERGVGTTVHVTLPVEQKE